MDVLTSAKGHKGLPRYFEPVFSVVKRLNAGRLDLRLPDGRVFRAEGKLPGPVAEVHIHNPEVFARMVREGDNGFSDAYLEGWWSTPDLQAFMDLLFSENDEVFDGFPGAALARTWERLRHWLRSNTKRGSRRNISYHYDLGNAFYAKWLDETMTYSSALFRSRQEDLARAQLQKYEAVVNGMGVRPGDHVLEIGCGWGGFAEYAAGERGLKVTGLTISREQHDFAVERMARAGLSDRVDIVMRDYRDEAGRYDGIASIEMFEAVGERYWPAFFDTVRERLHPGRRATLQIITVADRRYELYRSGVDFIRKHIFPGGALPSPSALVHQIERAGLERIGSIEFGDSYSQTLRLWFETFNRKWDEISAMGFDERFRRMWNFYLTSCAASFGGASRNCDVTQVTVARPA